MRSLIDRRTIFLPVEGRRRNDGALADYTGGGERCDVNDLVIRA